MWEEDDRSDDKEFERWAKAVKVRDNFTCAICEKRGVYLESHHLNSWDWCVDDRYSIDNGVTLCIFHHQRFHEAFGYGNNYDWQYKQYKKAYDVLKKVANNKIGS